MGYWLTNQYTLDVTASDSKASNTYETGVRVMEFVQYDVKVKGTGTKVRPWYFEDGYSVRIGSSNKE